MAIAEPIVCHGDIVAARSTGWALLEGQVSPAEGLALKEAVLDLVGHPDRHPTAICFFGVAAREQDRRLTRVERIWNELPVLHDTALARSLVGIARAYLDEDVVLFKDKVNIRHACSAGYPPHQDSAGGWEEFSNRFVTLGVFLAPSDLRHGGFEVVSCAHRRGRLPNVRGAMSQDDFDWLNPQPIEAGLGDVLLVDSETPHRTARNDSDTDSLHLLFTFAPAGAASARNAYYEKMSANVATLNADGGFLTRTSNDDSDAERKRS